VNEITFSSNIFASTEVRRCYSFPLFSGPFLASFRARQGNRFRIMAGVDALSTTRGFPHLDVDALLIALLLQLVGG
jgi:hypothetical protein